MSLTTSRMDSRWLKDAKTNARDEEIKEVKKTHSLKTLWITAKNECRRIIPQQAWNETNVQYVEDCILEFDNVDPDGERFRYHGSIFGIEKDAAKRRQMLTATKCEPPVDFQKLSDVIDRVHDVLWLLDAHMVETYGQNEEWEEILRSF